MKLVKISIIFILVVFAWVSGVAQDYKLHKVYIYNFAKNIEWPAGQQTGNFIIGILGKSEINNELKNLAASKTIGSQKIEIKEFNGFADITDCHLLFITAAQSKSFADVSAKYGGKPVVIVTEKSGLGKQGSSINFVLIEDKLKYEVNKTTLEKSGLKISSELTRLASAEF